MCVSVYRNHPPELLLPFFFNGLNYSRAIGALINKNTKANIGIMGYNKDDVTPLTRIISHLTRGIYGFSPSFFVVVVTLSRAM